MAREKAAGSGRKSKNPNAARTEVLPSPKGSQARPKVLFRGILVVRRAMEARARIVHRSQIGKLAVGLGRHGVHFVAQAKIECEVRANSIIVLNVATHDGLPNVARRQSARKRGDQGGGDRLPIF